MANNHDNKEWLVEEKVNKGRTTQSIAEECGVDASTISKRLRTFGIKYPIVRSVFELTCCDCATVYQSKGRKKGADGNFRCRKCQSKISNRKPNTIACQMLHRTSQRKKDKQFEWSLKNYYGITVEQYTILLESQNSVCKICGLPEPRGRLVVDHNHSNNAIRGLLCHNCNRALGVFNDNSDLLASAINYLHTSEAAAKVLIGTSMLEAPSSEIEFI